MLPFAKKQATLYEEWQYGLVHSQTNAEAVNSAISFSTQTPMYMAIMGFLLSAVVSYLDGYPWTLSTWLINVIFTGIYVTVIAIAITKMTRCVSATRNVHRDNFSPLTNENETKVRSLLVPLLPFFNIDQEQVALHCDVDDYACFPSMFEVNLIHLILPLGFFKLMNENESVSRVMLAHELGHAIQHDTSLWLRATAFTKYVVRWLIPLHAVTLLLTIGNAKSAYWLAQSNQTSYNSAAIIEVVKATIFFLSVIYVYIRTIPARRHSEAMADMAAVLATSVDDVSAALKHGQSLEKKRTGLYFGRAFHPTCRHRLEQIELFRNMLTGIENGGHITPIAIEGQGNASLLVQSLIGITAWGITICFAYLFGGNSPLECAICGLLAALASIFAFIRAIQWLLQKKLHRLVHRGKFIMSLSGLLVLPTWGVWLAATPLHLPNMVCEQLLPIIIIVGFFTFVIGLLTFGFGCVK